MAMGDLARMPRPDEAGDSYDVPLDPWQRATLAAQALQQTAPPQPSGPPPNMGSLYGMAGAGERAKSIGEGMARSADYYVGMPSRVMQGAPPETPGQLSEDDVARQDRLLAEQYGWAPSTALGMVFDPLGVKRSVGAGGVMLGSGAGSRIIQPEAPAGIRAYHSSPHDFDKFDFSPARGRTGEGAQTYGEGGYFAENPAVSGQGGKYWNQFLPRFAGTPEWEAALALKRGGFDREAVTRQMRAYVEDLRKAGDSDWRKSVLPLLESGKPVGPRTYEVKIQAHPDELLNYDVPLNHQVPEVQARLKEAMGPYRWNEFKVADTRTAMRNGFIAYDPRTASLRMQEEGIPGIRYLDEGSRSLPPQYDLSNPGQLAAYAHKLSPHNPLGAIDIVEGPVGEAARELIRAKARLPALADTAQRSSNYVMFPGTEDKVHIMAKYGLAGAVPTMGSLADMSYREQ
jgi:hypothetical protein